MRHVVMYVNNYLHASPQIYRRHSVQKHPVYRT